MIPRHGKPFIFNESRHDGKLLQLRRCRRPAQGRAISFLCIFRGFGRAILSLSYAALQHLKL